MYGRLILACSKHVKKDYGLALSGSGLWPALSDPKTHQK